MIKPQRPRRFDPERFLARAEQLPTLPALLVRARSLAESPDASVGELYLVLGRDLALAALILRQANAPARGFSGRLAAPSHALVLLGITAARQAIRAAPVLRPSRLGPGTDAARLWLHAAAVAALARRVARRAGVKLEEEAYAAGLFHDVGRIALRLGAPTLYRRLARAGVFGGAPTRARAAAERQLLGGLGCAELGARLARRWRLPALVEQAIRHHPAPGRAGRRGDARRLAATVHLANALASDLGAATGWGGENGSTGRPPAGAALAATTDGAWRALRLRRAAAAELQAAGRRVLAGLADFRELLGFRETFSTLGRLSQ